MHGRVKVRTSAEEAARKKKEQELKVKAYRAGMTRIFEKRRENEFDDEMLLITGQILQRNPDVYTLWNIRKECVLHLGNSLEKGDKQSLYEKELPFTEQCLMANPKSYGDWHHRCWVLENSPEPNWDREVALCSRYLKLDERNFHCWDYRRFVAKKAGITAEKELEFCTEKIRANFSNYSSWHYRSKLLPLVYPNESNKALLREDILKEELELVLTAAFTDPNDSSAWFYQRWLLGYTQPELDIAGFRIKKDKAVLSFSKPVNINELEISCNLTDINNKTWKPVNEGYLYDNTWVLLDKFDLHNPECEAHITCSINGNNFMLALKKCDEGYCGVKCPKFEYEFGKAVIEVLKTQLDSCNELLQFEPDSKWTLLTAALLMRAINRKDYHEKSAQYLQKLEQIDHLRKGYYEDLASKWNIEKCLEKWIESQTFPKKIDLSNQKISSLFYEQYLSIADVIDLSNNNLTDRSLRKTTVFQFCQELNLNNNPVSDLEIIPKLQSLRICFENANK